MPAWHFTPKRPRDHAREPIQGEFFSAEAIRNSASALVREGIQNSLDAARGLGTARVRLFLSGEEDALSPEKLRKYLGDAWPHYSAPRNGLRDMPDPKVGCPFLAFEDFGTTGLQGDPLQWYPRRGTKNGFYTFFRAEGFSEKEEGDRGRWGIGKFVFPRVSQLSSFWAVTVRRDDQKRLLMGRAILKSHSIEGKPFMPDGYFGEIKSLTSGDEIVAPVDDRRWIEAFCNDFGLKRGAEPGLSIVVPWYDSEVTQANLLQAVIEDYFFPILHGNLEVTVEAPGEIIELKADTLLSKLEEYDDELAVEMGPIIRLAEWRRELEEDQYITLNRMPETGAPRWSAKLFPDEQLSELRDRFQKNERIALRIPFVVRTKKGEKLWSHFDVIFERDTRDNRDRPIFIREGLVISDVRSPLSRGVRSMVIAAAGPLGTMLGDSENPAHTQWQRQGKNYVSKYNYPTENLTFVINSVSEIVRFITDADREADKSILVDVFSIPAAKDDPEAVNTLVRKQRSGERNGTGHEMPLAAPRRFKVKKVEGGFRVMPGDTGAPMPAKLDIRVAYEIRSGNPLKKYHPADFELDKPPIEVIPQGMNLTYRPGEDKAGNTMRAEVTESDFLLTVTGFDENRDLFVQVTVAKEESDGD